MANKITLLRDRRRRSDHRPAGWACCAGWSTTTDPEDEGLHGDMSWRRTSLIVEQEHGSMDEQLVEVSHEQASRIVQYFREKFEREAAGGASAGS